MNNSNEYSTPIIPTWCPGCGNFLVHAALKIALLGGKVSPHQAVIAYDIGCAGNMADFIKTYGIHTLHGRAIPVAMGVKMANPLLTVICVGGDGGLYGEGLNHLVAAARMDIDIKVLVSNNFLYSLTTGQASPTTPKGASTKSTPFGVPNVPLDAVKLVKSVNPSVFAHSVDVRQIVKLNQLVKQALDHPGFALLDIRQECVAFGKQLK